MTVDASGLATRRLVACALARAAGEIAKRRFLDRASFTVGFKGPQDYLTEVDGEIERFLAARLGEAFPEDGFLGEEEGKGRGVGGGGDAAGREGDPRDLRGGDGGEPRRAQKAQREERAARAGATRV